MTMRIYFATDIHGSEVCWRKFLNAARFYNADTLILGGDVSGKAVVPVVTKPGGGYLVHQLSGNKVLDKEEMLQAETRIRDMGFYPYRTTDERSEEHTSELQSRTKIAFTASGLSQMSSSSSSVVR